MIVSYFLIFIIGPLHIEIFHNSSDRLITSMIKASSAIGLVVVLILLLGMLKTKVLAKNITEKVKHEKSTSNYFESSVK